MMRWLLTYADMITLLLAFFVVMYATSNVDAAKYQTLASALSAAFGLTGNPSLLYAGGAEGSKPIVFPASQMQLQQLKNKLQKHVLEMKLEPAINLHLNERGLLIRIYADKVKFARGSAVLSPVFRRAMDRVGEVLATTPNAVEVNGYTDDSRFMNKAGSNWDLSAMRAVNTVKYLMKKGVAAERLSAVGWGENSPIYPNSDEVRRSLNRRIDIQVLKAPFLDEMMNASKIEKNISFKPAETPVPAPQEDLNSKPLTF